MNIPYTEKDQIKYTSERLSMASQEIEAALAALTNTEGLEIDIESLYAVVELVRRQAEILQEKLEESE